MRELLYGNDMADASLFLMTLPEESFAGLTAVQTLPLVNIGGGEEYSIQELAEMGREVTGFRGGITFETSKPDGTPRKLLYARQLERLRNRARIPLRQGIEQAYRHFLEQSAAAP